MSLAWRILFSAFTLTLVVLLWLIVNSLDEMREDVHRLNCVHVIYEDLSAVHQDAELAKECVER